jgi:hypothetical protein
MKIMEEIITYLTVEGHSSATLDSSVERKLKEGFQPYGNPYVFNNIFYQGMVKYKEKINVDSKKVL